MENRNTICVIKGDKKILENEHNETGRFVCPLGLTYEDEAASLASGSFNDEDGTPVPNRSNELITVIRITTDHKPKDLQRGFVFGRDEAVCDVLLDHPAISQKQFAVRPVWEYGTVVLQNLSKHGTAVNFCVLNESILLRNTRALMEYETGAISLADVYQLQLQRPGDPVGWADYCRDTMSDYVPSVNLLGLDVAPESTNASRRPPVYLAGRQLGTGANCNVFQAIEKYTGRLCAMKVFQKPERSRWQEPQILEGLRHKHIVRYVSYHRPAEQAAQLIMEFIGGPTLQQLLAQQGEDWLMKPYEAQELLRQLTDTAAYLHSKGITHRDIKPANIMIARPGPDLLIKLIDFGEATAAAQFDTCCGTPCYMAPELLVPGVVCTNKVDVFSIGVVALQLLFRLPRMPAGCQPRQWLDVVGRYTRYLTHQQPPTASLAFVCLLLREMHEQRPAAKDCLDHDFFAPGGAAGPRPLSVDSFDHSRLPLGVSGSFGEGQHRGLEPESLRDTVSFAGPSQKAVGDEAVDDDDDDDNDDDGARSDTTTILIHSGTDADATTSPSMAPKHIVVKGRPIAVWHPDGWLSFGDLCAAARTTHVMRLKYTYCFRDRGVFVGVDGGESWVPFEDGCFLADVAGLDLAPFVAFGAALAAVQVPDLRGNYLRLPQCPPAQYAVLWWNDKAIFYRPEGRTVNATHLTQALGAKKGWLYTTLIRYPELHKSIVSGRWGVGGTYLALEDALGLCQLSSLDPQPLRIIAARCGVEQTAEFWRNFSVAEGGQKGAEIGDEVPDNGDREGLDEPDDERDDDTDDDDDDDDDDDENDEGNGISDDDGDSELEIQRESGLDAVASGSVEAANLTAATAAATAHAQLATESWRFSWDNVSLYWATPPPQNASGPNRTASTDTASTSIGCMQTTAGIQQDGVERCGHRLRTGNHTVNVTQLVRSMGVSRTVLASYLTRHPDVPKTRLPGNPAAQGTYMAANSAALLQLLDALGAGVQAADVGFVERVCQLAL
ncbi:Protein kinase-like domain protein [Niveomyces insectorum RCEF 264]|uniref:non-specific serine/threonine protein kinase n=1 Tax=Niveomyces insectorum RCEF 264 TaxID=1081102 RepID=A0A167WES5_9HYPO|nr:Protein kinase-like domain protein [Niveomyces insectorum RCEF 264]